MHEEVVEGRWPQQPLISDRRMAESEWRLEGCWLGDREGENAVSSDQKEEVRAGENDATWLPRRAPFRFLFL